jgi:broad specificity phosphatase PhoE
MSRGDAGSEFRLDAPMANGRTMKIVLMRHGEPTSRGSAWIAGHEFGEWVRSFDQGGIKEAMLIPDEVRQLASTIGLVISSDLLRATQSAARMARKTVIDPDLREACLIESFRTSLRAPASLWLAVARLAWWLDVTSSQEPIAAARARAQRVTDNVISLAREHRSVLVVGHGVFNSFIARRLRALGWSGPLLPPSRYWSVATYRPPHSKKPG